MPEGWMANRDELTELDALAQAELVRRKEATALALVEAAIARRARLRGRASRLRDGARRSRERRRRLDPDPRVLLWRVRPEADARAGPGRPPLWRAPGRARRRARADPLGAGQRRAAGCHRRARF